MKPVIRAAAVIPARYGSTRFPGKPLALIQGRPMILWTLAQVRRALQIQRIVVATDCDRIEEIVRGDGGEVIMTASDLASGTDRVAVAATSIDTDLVANVHGDEPLIDPAHIDLAVLALIDDPLASVATLAAPIRSEADLMDENIVKVLVDERQHAVYFSRIPIPYPGRLSHRKSGDIQGYFRHIGLYVYRKAFLMRFAEHPPVFSERIERLEQLRTLEMGEKIAVRFVETNAPSIDTPDDLTKLDTLLRRR